jgi:hypothetical protein
MRSGALEREREEEEEEEDEDRRCCAPLHYIHMLYNI